MDWLRTVAITGVLLIHSATRYAQSDVEIVIGKWLALFSRPSIAIFLFLAGYFFRTDGLSPAYLGQKYQRVVFPYFFFAVLATVYQHKGASWAYIQAHPGLWIRDLLLGNTFGLYYFVFVILYLYALGFVVLRRPRWQDRLPVITLGALLLNLVQAVAYEPLLQYYGVDQHPLALLYRERYLLSWPFFFFLGVLFRLKGGQRWIETYRGRIRWTWIALFLGYSAIYFSGNHNIDGYNSVFGTIYSVATIGLLLTWYVEHRAVTFISQISYSIYLSHIFIVFMLDGWGDARGLAWPYWFSLVSFVASFAGSVAYYYLAKYVLQEHSRFLIGA